jgi:hypothetical protein
VSLALLCFCCTALPSLAASWRGIEPGVSSRTEVLSRFGEPSQTLKPGDKEVFVYRDGRRLKGTQQVKFRAERASGKVDRIDVFPTVEVDRAAVESTYGPACPDNVPGPRCYLPKLTEDNRIYFHYPTQGVGVFFRPNGRTVFAFAYILAEPLETETGATATSGETSGSGEGTTEETATDTTGAEASEGEQPGAFAGFEGLGVSDTGGVESAALSDKLQIGGNVFLQGELGAVRTPAGNTGLGSASAPMIVDVYLDGRPNDRVRGMMVTRLAFDPTIGPDGAQALGVAGGAGMPGGSNPSLLLDQLWIKFDLNRLVYLTIGRQHAKWGSSRIWSTVDYLIPQRLNPLALFDQRVGNDMVKVHVPLESVGMNLYAVGFVTATGGDSPALRGGGAARAEIVLGDGEYALSGRIEKDRPAQAGFDFSTGLGPVDLRGELAVRWRPDRRLWRRVAAPEGTTVASQYELVDPMRGALPYPHATLGIDYQHQLTEENSLAFALEGYANSLGYDDPDLVPWLLANGDLHFFYAGRYYAGLTATYTHGSSEIPWNAAFMALGNVSDGSGIVRLSGGWTVLNDLSLGAYVQAALGRPGGEFRLGGTLLVPPASPEADFTAIKVGVPLLNVGITLGIRI